MDFSEGEPKNLIPLNGGGLNDYGCIFWLGFDGAEERLIYSLDFELSFLEKRFPKGTIENLIISLPLADDLEIENSNGHIITRTK